MANYIKPILFSVGLGLVASVGISKYQDFKKQELQHSLEPLKKDTFDIQCKLDSNGNFKDTIYLPSLDTIYLEEIPDNKIVNYALNHKSDTIKFDTLSAKAQAIAEKQFKNLKKLK